MLEKLKTELTSLTDKLKNATLIEKLVYFAFCMLALAACMLVCC